MGHYLENRAFFETGAFFKRFFHVFFNSELLSDRFDTSGSPVALFVPEIWLTRFFVTKVQEQELAILGSSLFPSAISSITVTNISQLISIVSVFSQQSPTK